jgi:CDGSH-type Zn-finger protein
VVRLQRDGPYVATGRFVLLTPTGPRERATLVLCRCGLSANKPYCDGAHARAGFADPALLEPVPPASVAEDAPVTVTPRHNGPLRCEGPLIVEDLVGRRAASAMTVLCRCGGSATRPYCDGSHKRNGFTG